MSRLWRLYVRLVFCLSCSRLFRHPSQVNFVRKISIFFATDKRERIEMINDTWEAEGHWWTKRYFCGAYSGNGFPSLAKIQWCKCEKSWYYRARSLYTVQCRKTIFFRLYKKKSVSQTTTSLNHGVWKRVEMIDGMKNKSQLRRVCIARKIELCLVLKFVKQTSEISPKKKW